MTDDNYNLYHIGDYVAFRYTDEGSLIHGEGYITKVSAVGGMCYYRVATMGVDGEYLPVTNPAGIKIRFVESDLLFLRSK